MNAKAKTSPAKGKSKQIDADSVANYLQQHPDFFIEKSDLLSSLNFQHASDDPNSSTVSIFHRQIDRLRQENAALIQQLSELIAAGKDNDNLLHKFRQLLSALIRCTELSSFNNTLNQQLSEIFNLSDSHLFLSSDAQSLFYMDDNLSKLLTKKTRRQPVFCGRLPKKEQALVLACWPEKSADNIQSVAIAQLESEGFWIIGSNNEDHFHANMHTLFLQLAADLMTAMLTHIGKTESE